jgi:son of sevenless-like protein
VHNVNDIDGKLTKQECKNLNNFSTIASLCAGINSSPINRMKRTLETVTGKWLTLKSELDGFMDSTKNFSHYKETLKAINPPCVPFLGELYFLV